MKRSYYFVCIQFVFSIKTSLPSVSSNIFCVYVWAAFAYWTTCPQLQLRLCYSSKFLVYSAIMLLVKCHKFMSTTGLRVDTNIGFVISS